MKPGKLLFLLAAFAVLSGCASAPKETVELSEVVDHQITELHKSHIKFVTLYYDKLQQDVNQFIDNKWAPTFLSKAVNNQEFRNDLDGAYITSSISESDISVTWEGRALAEPQKSVVLAGIKQAVTDEKAKMGQVLIDWSEDAQRQITKKRAELLKPVTDQEKLVLNEINVAYLDLQRSQAAIKGYLASAVELKENQDEVLRKLGALKKVESVMDKVTSANDELSSILGSDDDAKDVVKRFKEKLSKAKEDIKKLSQ